MADPMFTSAAGSEPTSPTEKRLFARLLSALERPIYQAIPKAENKKSLTRTLLVIVLLGLLGFAVFTVVKLSRAPKPIPSVLSRMEGIKRIRELHLIRLHYESIIPITERKKRGKKNEKEIPQFLLVAPMELSLYVDMGKMKMELQPDSLVIIALPDPELSKVYINFHDVKEYQMSDGWSLKDIKLGLSYSEVYQDIAYKLTEAKDEVSARATHPAILSDTRDKAENYLRNLINSLGYRVEFVYPQDEVEDERKRGIYEGQIREYLKEQNLDPKELLDQLNLKKRILIP
ncbi:DUF4230 domain-containing protein [bacterium]|nr:DUF4230 domain-containing protein [bacterium]